MRGWPGRIKSQLKQGGGYARIAAIGDKWRPCRLVGSWYLRAWDNRNFEIEAELSRMLGRKVDLNTPGFLSRYFRDEVQAEAEVQYVALDSRVL